MKKNAWIIAVLFLAMGILFGWQAAKESLKEKDLVRIRQEDHHFRFINPLIGFEIGDKEDFPELQPLEKKLNAYVEKTLREGKMQFISAYVRNLKTGSWTGVNESATYNPASLLKVLIMIGHLKRAQGNPNALSKKLYYEGAVDMNDWEHYKPEKSLTGGKWYPTLELIERMIVESGNNSTYLLRNDLGFPYFHDLYTDFALPSPKNDEQFDFMSAKDYSLLFRTLYNATYLTREMSEKALEILSRTRFEKGLMAGLPQDLTVAHKFGELPNELHDCGIVYVPKKPYFICVMTKGNEKVAFEDLEKVIAGISSIAYEYLK